MPFARRVKSCCKTLIMRSLQGRAVPTYPLKLEVELSKPWHGVKHVEVQVNAIHSATLDFD